MINIDTTSQKYQNYMAGLSALKVDMLPRLKAFSELSRAKQRWWLQRDPLLRKLVKLSISISKHLPIDEFVEDVSND